MGCGDVCLLNDEGFRAIEGSSRPPLINLTVPAFRLPSLERAAEQALSEICEIRVEGDLVGVVDVPIELRLYR